MSLLFTRWPLVAKVPAVVAVLMILAAAVMSGWVWVRLTQEQDSRVAALSGAYLDSTAASLAPSLARGDVWEAFDILDRGRHAFGALRLRLAIAILPDGKVLAATDPRRLPIGVSLDPALAARNLDAVQVDRDAGLAWAARDVVESGSRLGRIMVEIDMAHEGAERVRLGLQLAAANTALASGLAVLGWWLTRRMLRPVQLLAAHLGGALDRGPLPLDAADVAGTGQEFQALFRQFNAMAASVEEREALAAQVAEEERLALLGTLAGSMAHEVNNPLGGMMTALDTLDGHGGDATVRAQSVGFLRRGLEDIRNVVRVSLVLYRSTPDQAGLLTRQALDDLRLLAGPEAMRREVSLTWDNHLDEVAVNVTPVRQVVLNLLLNAIAASPPRGVVKLSAWCRAGHLAVEVSDQGPGLPPAMAAILSAPGAMPVAGNTGLGLWTAARAASGLGGAIRHIPGLAGTTLQLDVPLEYCGADLAA